MISELKLQVELKNGITILKNCYCSKPFKIADIREDKKDPELRLMLMSSSPGILDGDEYKIGINLEEGCSLSLHSQSYQRLYTMEGSAAQLMEVTMAENSRFKYLPLPVVPHKNSSFTAVNKIYLSRSCTLIWGEILTCGRKLNGEQFSLKRYHNVTSVYMERKLIIKENLLLEPAKIDVTRIGQYESYTHQASLILIHHKIEVARVQEELLSVINACNDIAGGVTEAPGNAILVRVLGMKAEQLHKILSNVSAAFEGLIKPKQLV